MGLANGLVKEFGRSVATGEVNRSLGFALSVKSCL